MHRIAPAKTAFSVGLVIAIWHVIWVTLVASGLAKPFMDFILQLHFIEVRYDLAPFVLRTAAMLIALTFCVGMFLGFVFALTWNWLTVSITNDAPLTQTVASV